MIEHQFVTLPSGQTKIRFQCPACQATINAGIADAGNPNRCPSCKASFVVPGLGGGPHVAAMETSKPIQPTPAPLPEDPDKWMTPPRYRAIEAVSSIYRIVAIAVGVIWTIAGSILFASSVASGFAMDGVLTLLAGTIIVVIVVCFLLAFSELLKLAISAERSLFKMANSKQS